VNYAILTMITALVFAMAMLSSPGARLRDLPRRIRREVHWYFVARPRYRNRPIAGGSLTDVTDGSRVIAEGIAPCQVALSAAALPGDLLGKSGSTWVLADGNNSVYAELVAGQKGASGDTITAFRIARVSALSGAAIGDPVYLSDTAGGYSASAGTVGQIVGVAISATEVLLFPNYITGGQMTQGALKQFFRDSGLYMHSNADGKLTISADGTGNDDITLDGSVRTNEGLVLSDVESTIAVSADKTLALADCGVIQLVDTDAKTVTLPATAPGLEYTIVNTGADGAVLVTISPQAADKISGAGLTPADNKDLLNTKATAKKGDFVTLLADGVDGWVVTRLAGTWAREG